MKENLFFRATRSTIELPDINRVFFNLVLLSLLCILTFSNAYALEPVRPQQDQKDVIYVSDDVTVFGTDEFSNATVVKLKGVPAQKNSKKATHSPIRNEIHISKKLVEKPADKHPKSFQTSYVFQSSRSGENVNSGSFSNSRNSVIIPFFSVKNCVAYSDITVSVPMYSYRMNIYVADFSKTAALSHFLFSRPPPIC